ncbi:MAG: cytochrome b/b6 domain-containing protein [Hydrogenophaga sp.]|nr:cytochrome b/b6 domain-containing protein [Hydrogenophaga sp.]
MQIVRVWDLPTRLFHWALATCVVGLIVTGNVGGNWMSWHGRLGYAVLTLLFFRLAWGFVGGHWSRFGNFIYGPSTILNHLRGNGRPEHQVGHNPLGMLSVFALIAVLFLQVGSGLFSDDEIAFTGPLAGLVSGDWVSQATSYHKKLGKLILIVLVTLHLGAIGYYRLIKKENLVRSMILGDKEVPSPVAASNDSLSHRLLALALLVVCALAVYFIVALGDGAPAVSSFD